MVTDDMKKEMDQAVAEAYKAKPIRDKILTTHEATHGNYSRTAECAQTLKTVFRSQEGYANLTAVQRESLDLTCTKWARILCGNPDFKDHWDDLAGYAKLVAETLV